MVTDSNGHQTPSASGCCFLGLIIAVFAALWYLIKYAVKAFYWMLKYIFVAMYYAIAAPFLIFEFLWRRGGLWRPILLVLTGCVLLLALIAFLVAPTRPTTQSTAPAATQTPTPSPSAQPSATLTLTLSATIAATDTIVPPTQTIVPTTVPTVSVTIASAPTATTEATAVEPTAVPIPAEATAPPADGKVPARISAVVDGDTVKLNYQGKVVSIRMIGVDTPETKDPRKPVQCFGREATEYTKKTLLNQDVMIAHDPTQDTLDKYQRPLLYIWLPDGTLFNQLIIQEGYAFEYTYRVPYQYQEAFKAAENDARSAGRGLWAATTCNGVASPITPTP
ncbi:MAG: hypothetical protein RLY87_2621 [Chloroflexota bacterium]|jgi:micrococcal nuclease